MFFGLNDVAFLAAVSAPTGPALWTPADITTALWLDAADAGTITESGGAVSEWRDKSGNARHFLQSTALDQPTYSTSSWNGSPAVLFNQSFLSPATDITANGQSWYFVTQRTGGPLTSSVMGAQATSFIPIASSGSVNDVRVFRINNTDNPSSLSAFINGTLVKNKNAQPTIDRNDIYNALANKLILETCGILNFGAVPELGRAISGYSSFFLVGMIAEVVVSSNDSSTSERQLIEGYLAHKWGLTANLPNDHPYKTAAPTL
jgi:hypothetical protein